MFNHVFMHLLFEKMYSVLNVSIYVKTYKRVHLIYSPRLTLWYIYIYIYIYISALWDHSSGQWIRNSCNASFCTKFFTAFSIRQQLFRAKEMAYPHQIWEEEWGCSLHSFLSKGVGVSLACVDHKRQFGLIHHMRIVKCTIVIVKIYLLHKCTYHVLSIFLFY